MNTLRQSGHPYRVSGADRVTGKDTELTIHAYDEADASRMANRQGILVSGCVAAAAEGTFSQAVLEDPVVKRLLGMFPQLGPRLRRLNVDDQAYLSNLTYELGGVSCRDAADVARVIQENRHLPIS